MGHGHCQCAVPGCPEMSRLENVLHCPCMAVHLIESSHDPSSSGYTYDSVPLGRAVMEHDNCPLHPHLCMCHPCLFVCLFVYLCHQCTCCLFVCLFVSPSRLFP